MHERNDFLSVGAREGDEGRGGVLLSGESLNNAETAEQDGNRPIAADAARRRRRSAVILAGSGLVALGIAGLWSQRVPLADDFVQKELERRNVSARYDLTEIGFRTQRIENLSLGDPRNPDVTARWVEIITRLGWTGFEVTEVRADGLRINGRLVDGTVRFGELDKLLPAPSGKPFSLPDLKVDLADTRLRIDMPGGVVGFALAGRGNLTNGFHGKLAVRSPQLSFGACRGDALAGSFDLAITDRRPTINGPLRASTLTCSDNGLAVSRPRLVVEARLAEALDRWQGSAGLDLREVRLGGNRLTEVIGTAGFEGEKTATRGDIKLAIGSLVAAGGAARDASLHGQYVAGMAREGFSLKLKGNAEARHLALDDASRRSIVAFGSAGSGTPIGPILSDLARAAERAASGAAVKGGFQLDHVGSAGTMQIATLSAVSQSGARASLWAG